jgi:hypothetical protein
MFAKRGWKKAPSQLRGNRAYRCVCGDWHLGRLEDRGSPI